MDVLRLKTLIKGWYEKGFRENDHFSKFLFLWICFNAWLDYSSGKEKDFEMIDWLISQSSVTSDLVKTFEDLKTKRHFRGALKVFANMTPIRDSRGSRDPIEIRDEDDFENIVRAIYRIRCNLFHGGKSANESRDLKLVVVSNEILKYWIGSLMASW